MSELNETNKITVVRYFIDKHHTKIMTVPYSHALYDRGEFGQYLGQPLVVAASDDPEELAALMSIKLGYYSSNEEYERLYKLLDRTAVAVMQYSGVLAVPRCTDEHPNGQDLAQAVEHGFIEANDKIKQLEDELWDKKSQLDHWINQYRTDVRMLEQQLNERELLITSKDSYITELKGQLREREKFIEVEEQVITNREGYIEVQEKELAELRAQLTEKENFIGLLEKQLSYRDGLIERQDQQLMEARREREEALSDASLHQDARIGVEAQLRAATEQIQEMDRLLHGKETRIKAKDLQISMLQTQAKELARAYQHAISYNVAQGGVDMANVERDRSGTITVSLLGQDGERLVIPTSTQDFGQINLSGHRMTAAQAARIGDGFAGIIRDGDLRTVSGHELRQLKEDHAQTQKMWEDSNKAYVRLLQRVQDYQRYGKVLLLQLRAAQHDHNVERGYSTNSDWKMKNLDKSWATSLDYGQEMRRMATLLQEDGLIE